jgi:L-lactate dehydrogenase
VPVDTVNTMSENPLRRNKIAIVGAGSVGATLAYASLIRGVAHDVVLYDMNADKVQALALINI